MGEFQKAGWGVVGGQLCQDPPGWLCGCGPCSAGSVMQRLGENILNLERLSSCCQIRNGRPSVSLSI